MAEPKFALNEIVFAKIKGYPPWPAKVEYLENSQSTSKVKYSVYFYGATTSQIGLCREEDLFSYAENRKKLGKPKKSKSFMKAIFQADSELKSRSRCAEVTPTDDLPSGISNSSVEVTTTNVLPSRISNSSDLNYLKAELQLLKIDREIKISLNIGLHKPDFDGCLKLLDEYSQVTINPLMFMKNPELIGTLLKLQVYSKNTNFRNTPDTNVKDSEDRKMFLIREKARNIFYRVQSLFIIPQGKIFIELLAEHLIQFQKGVENISADKVIQLTKDPTITE